MEIRIDVSDLRADMQAIAAQLRDVSSALRKWGRDYYVPATMSTLRACGVASRGGTDARLSAAGLPPWPPAADQYTRETDGVTVPAWGGVPKARGRGMVKGRRRKSKARMAPTSQLMQDTNQMVRGALNAPKVVTPNMIRYEASAPYAWDATHASKTPREWLFAAPQDEAALVLEIERLIERKIQETGAGP